MSAQFYSEQHIIAYPVEYLAGIDLYNAGEFHAAHDAWEERWMGPVAPDEKLFLQAMIQSAVAFHHLQVGRAGAARQMYLPAEEKFARLAIINRGGCEISLLLLVIGFFATRGAMPLVQFGEMIWLAIVAIMTALGHWVIAARMLTLRTAVQLPIDQIAPGDPRRVEFD